MQGKLVRSLYGTRAVKSLEAKLHAQHEHLGGGGSYTQRTRVTKTRGSIGLGLERE